MIAGLALLLAVSVAASSVENGPAEPARPTGAHAADVLLSDAPELSSTADRRQRRLIRRLRGGYRGAAELAELKIDYPSDESVFPPEMLAPTFLWHDESDVADGWLVDVALAGGATHVFVLVPGDPPPRGEIDPRCIAITNEIYEPTPYQASARSWKPSAALWEVIRDRSAGASTSITILGYRNDDPDRVVSRGRMSLRTSADPVGAPIFYRDVPLMPSETKEGVIKPLDRTAGPLIAWRLRDVSRPDSRVLLRDMPTCANCHSFSADGKTLGMDVDGPDGDKGAYTIAGVQKDVVIRDEQVMTWNAFEDKPAGLNTLGFMSRLSPDGGHVVSTVNEAIYVSNFTDHRFIQVFYPTRGILAYYSRETGEIKALPGADDPEFVHCNADWTPDGTDLVFARARARDPYEKGRPIARYAGDPNETPMRYDLYRIPFNDGRGGRPEPIAGASNNGMSNSFPKVSPDGRWIVFVKARNGLLMRPDSKLWIVPTAGGEARPLQSNLPLMNSWHSFSPNGRWLVFSSKSNTPYTQMFLTHLDDEGNASPALLIENSTAANRAVNIPEFVNAPYEEFESISVPAVDHYRYFQRGSELAREGRLGEAVAEFETALEGEWREWRLNDWRIHDSMSKSLLQLGQTKRALHHIGQSLKRNPYNVEMHANAGYLLSETGDAENASMHLGLAIRLRPRDPKLWCDRATIRLRAKDATAAVEDYTEAIRLDPEYTEAYNGRGTALMANGDLPGAVADFERAMQLDPDDPTPWYFRALIKKRNDDLSGALSDLNRALRIAPADSPQLAEIDALRLQLRERLDR
ncbi:MAG: tetratricopeptide repeat protein [bacterium]|nr:tetratricopeptide repeat protein [bacterium]